MLDDFRVESAILCSGFALSLSRTNWNGRELMLGLGNSKLIWCIAAYVFCLILYKTTIYFDSRWQKFKSTNFNFRLCSDSGLCIIPLLPITLLISYLTTEQTNVSFNIVMLMTLVWLISSYVTLYYLTENGDIENTLILSSGFTSLVGILVIRQTMCCSAGWMASILVPVTSSCVYYYVWLQLMTKNLSSFTLGEAILVAQAVAVLFAASVVNCLHFPSVISTWSQLHQLSLLVFLSVILVIFILIRFKSDNQLNQSAIFYSALFGIGLSLSYPLAFWILNGEPLTWLISFSLNRTLRVSLMMWWLVCTMIAVAPVVLGRNNVLVDDSKTVVRKLFHLVAILVFLPGLLTDPQLLFIVSVFSFALFLLFECIRILQVIPFGASLQSSLEMFLDEKDSGQLILTHIYLLLGMSCPLWLSHTQNGFNLSSFAGLLSLGVGDTAASVAGFYLGKHKWRKSSGKSMEGSFVAFCVQFAATMLPWCLKGQVAIANTLHIAVATMLCCLLEGFTKQVDNLTLPLFLYLMLVTL